MTDTLRKCIIAETGYTFLSLDASQIELRVLAVLSRDPRMLEDLKSGDLHMATAIHMYGYTDDPVEMKRRRYKAKQGNFALVYGADAYKLSEMLDCTVAEAEAFMAEHRDTYPILYEWMEEKKTEAKENGYVISMFGRIRPIPELFAGSWKIREKAEREIVNTIVQGTAVDLVKLAMLLLRGLFSPSIHLVLQVHDEMVWEVPDGLLPQALEQSKELERYFPDYPYTCVIGKVYGNMKEIQ